MVNRDRVTYHLKPTDLNGNSVDDLSKKGAGLAMTTAYGAYADVADFAASK